MAKKQLELDSNSTAMLYNCLLPVNKYTYLIIDFDSTFIKVESLDVLAEIALENNPDKEKIVAEIKRITSLGMEGRLGFDESVRKRLEILNANRAHLKKLSRILKKQITDSFNANKQFFLDNLERIYLISGGFHEFIDELVADFGINPDNVLANSFIFDEKGNIVGFDKDNPLSQKKGKVKAIKKLKLDGEVIVLGDGFTDYQIKQAGLARQFIYFAENVKRESVMKLADKVVNNFEEFLEYEKTFLS